jgi:hypothetical protein
MWNFIGRRHRGHEQIRTAADQPEHCRAEETSNQPGLGHDRPGQDLRDRAGGSTFEGSAVLVFHFSAAEIPDGVPVDNLYIAWWDPETLTWVDLEGTVDAGTGTVSVPLSHLSLYSLMVHNRPASLELTNFVVTPDAVGPGETVTASIDISNQGDLPGTYQADLMLDASLIQSQTVTLDGGGSETIVFNIVPDTAGEYRLSLGGFTADFTVVAPPKVADFTLNGLDITPESVSPGELVNVSFSIINTGDLAGTYPVTLYVDGVAIETMSSP